MATEFAYVPATKDGFTVIAAKMTPRLYFFAEDLVDLTTEERAQYDGPYQDYPEDMPYWLKR